eukprot:3089157-Rhodomonas_salina.1
MSRAGELDSGAAGSDAKRPVPNCSHVRGQTSARARVKSQMTAGQTPARGWSNEGDDVWQGWSMQVGVERTVSKCVERNTHRHTQTS